MVVYNERGVATTNAEPRRYDMTEQIFEITHKVVETRDDFIFSTISNYMEQDTEMSKIVVSKQILNRAVQCFYKEHREEYDRLVEEMVTRNGKFEWI